MSGLFELRKLNVTKLRRIPKEDDLVDFSYTITLSGKEKETFRCRENATTGLPNTLVYLLEDYVKRAKDPVFGVSLESIMPTPQSLPMIFRKALYHLDKAAEKDNLFRKPGNHAVVLQMRVNEGKTSISLPLYIVANIDVDIQVFPRIMISVVATEMTWQISFSCT